MVKRKHLLFLCPEVEIFIPVVVGEYERLYYCCNSPPESLGCTTGPHVYKGNAKMKYFAQFSLLSKNSILDESIQALAMRIPFSAVKSVNGAKKDIRQIIALDCEMVS